MELKEGSRIFMDTAPIIYFIEENPVYKGTISGVFTKVGEGKIEIFTSIITLIEVLTKPYKLGKVNIAKTYKDFFYNSKGFTVVALNPDIADLAARIRAQFGFKLPDAIQLAIFESINCDFFYTNDIQLKRYNDKKVVVLSDLLQ
jgi:predicted nucleic acid-binding protein